MNYHEFVDNLPLSDKYKNWIIDVGITIGIAIFNVYDKNVFTIVVSIVGFGILCMRGVRTYWEMQKAKHECLKAEKERIETENKGSKLKVLK